MAPKLWLRACPPAGRLRWRGERYNHRGVAVVEQRYPDRADRLFDRCCMRLLTIFLFAAVLGPCAGSAQVSPAPGQPGAVLVDDVPEGTNWIANARTRMYYRVACPITTTIPQAARLYYKNVSSLEAAGFKKSEQCDRTGASAEAVTPVPNQPPPGREASAPPVATKGTAELKNPRKGFWFNVGLGY